MWIPLEHMIPKKWEIENSHCQSAVACHHLAISDPQSDDQSLASNHRQKSDHLHRSLKWTGNIDAWIQTMPSAVSYISLPLSSNVTRFHTINTEGIFHFDIFGGIFTEDRHHIQEVFKCQVAVSGRWENLTDSISERIHLESDIRMR